MEIVRKMREHKRRSPRYGNPGLFSGVAYCSDCGEKLYFNTRAVWNKAKTIVRYEGSYSCSNYCKDVQYQAERACTCHYIRETVLEQLVLVELRDLLAFISRHEKQFMRLVKDKSKPEQARGNLGQNVEIIYNKIGAVDLGSWERESTETSA